MFTVDNVIFNRADGTQVMGVCNAINEANRQQQVIFAYSGLNWCMPYQDFFASVPGTNDGERPEFMPLCDGKPYRFSTGDRVWDPQTDTGMELPT